MNHQPKHSKRVLISPPSICNSNKKPKQTRNVPTNLMRKTLCDWWADDSYGVRSHEDAITWWLQQYRTKLSSSSCSEYLSDLQAKLDNKEDACLSKYQLTAKRIHKPKWAALENVLIEWRIRYDRYPDSGPTTGELLRVKATEFWRKLPEYQGVQCPKWSEGWLTGFKKRYGIREKKRHGEEASMY